MALRTTYSAVSSLVALYLFFSSSSASAGSAANRAEQERAARKACLSGQVAEGVAALSDLYLDTRNPTYLFNQGRCFEQNRRFQDAIGRFEEYLRAAETASKAVSERDVSDAKKHIASCKELLAEQLKAEKAASTIEPPPPNATPPSDVASAERDPQAEPGILTSPPPAASADAAPRGAGLRIAGITLAATGVAAGAVGLFANLKANSITQDMESKVAGYTSNTASQRQTYQTLTWIGYGAGAACLATGIVLYLLGSDTSASPSTLTLAPTAAPDRTGLVLTGVF